MWAPSDSAITIGSRGFAVPRSIQGWMMCSRSFSRASAGSYLEVVSLLALCCKTRCRGDPRVEPGDRPYGEINGEAGCVYAPALTAPHIFWRYCDPPLAV